jgi:hypothetical protein
VGWNELWWIVLNIALPLGVLALARAWFWFLLPDSGWSEIIRDGQVCGFAATLGAAAISDFNRHARPDHAGLVSVSNLIMPLLLVGALITFCAALSQPAVGPAYRDRLRRRVIGASLALLGTTVGFVLFFRFMLGEFR